MITALPAVIVSVYFLVVPTDKVKLPVASLGSETEILETKFSVVITSFKVALYLGISILNVRFALLNCLSPEYVTTASQSPGANISIVILA